ncbi:hypothetical protein EDB84DRAFT_1438484 [Lactarius hengduanensis]|nr:hypothetical protein EDB84DRAFT_1438484 [Lactarius hengduanensis]
MGCTELNEGRVVEGNRRSRMPPRGASQRWPLQLGTRRLSRKCRSSGGTVNDTRLWGGPCTRSRYVFYKNDASDSTVTASAHGPWVRASSELKHRRMCVKRARPPSGDLADDSNASKYTKDSSIVEIACRVGAMGQKAKRQRRTRTKSVAVKSKSSAAADAFRVSGPRAPRGEQGGQHQCTTVIGIGAGAGSRNAPASSPSSFPAVALRERRPVTKPRRAPFLTCKPVATTKAPSTPALATLAAAAVSLLNSSRGPCGRKPSDRNLYSNVSFSYRQARASGPSLKPAGSKTRRKPRVGGETDGILVFHTSLGTIGYKAPSWTLKALDADEEIEGFACFRPQFTSEQQAIYVPLYVCFTAHAANALSIGTPTPPLP